MPGLDRLRLVLDRLRDGEGDARDRLQAAGYEFLLAARAREFWPADLRGEAERVRAALMTIGVADHGVWEANEVEVVATTHDLRRLCERAERAFAAAARPERERAAAGWPGRGADRLLRVALS